MEPLVRIDQLEMFAHGLDHAEGIVMTPDGAIYVGGEAGQLYRVHDDDTIEQVAATGGWLLGLAADAAGHVYGCDAVKKRVWTGGASTQPGTTTSPTPAPGRAPTG